MARLIRLRQFKSVTKSLRYFVQRSGMVLTGAAVLVVSALVATPASPARAGSTTVSFTVLSGPLSINTPLPVSRLAAGLTQVRQAQIRRLKIGDARAVGANPDWAASITWSDTQPATAPTINTIAVAYIPSRLTQGEVAVHTARTPEPTGLNGRARTAHEVLAGHLANRNPFFHVAAAANASSPMTTITYSVW